MLKIAITSNLSLDCSGDSPTQALEIDFSEQKSSSEERTIQQFNERVNTPLSEFPHTVSFLATPITACSPKIPNPLSSSNHVFVSFTSIGVAGNGRSKTVATGILSSSTEPLSDSPPITPLHVMSYLKKGCSVEQAQYGIQIHLECRNFSDNVAQITHISEDCSRVVMHRYKGQLKDLFEKDDERKTRVAYQICETIRAMHQNDIAHYDLKPENILLNSNLDTAFLTDFECAIRTNPDGEPKEERLEITPGNTTESYNPPKQDHCLPKTRDVYSLGATLFYLFTDGKYLLQECVSILPKDVSTQPKEFKELLEDRTRAQYLMFTTDEIIHQVIDKYIANEQLQDLLKQMLNLNPAQRATMDGVIRHPFFHKTARQYLVEDTIIADFCHQALATGLVADLIETVH